MNEAINPGYETYLFEDCNFFINSIIDSLNRYLVRAKGSDEHYLYRDKFLRQLNVKLHRKYQNSKDLVMFGGICFDPGIKNDCMVRIDDPRDQNKPFRLRPFNLYSALESHLHAENLLLPSFHFYCKNEVNIDDETDSLAKMIFDILRKDIIKYAKNFLDEMKKYPAKKNRRQQRKHSSD